MRQGYIEHVESGYTITATINSAGTGQGYLGPVPQGYCWYLERASSYIAHTAVLELAVVTQQALPNLTANWDRAARQFWAATGADIQIDANQPVYVGPGYYLVAYWTGGTSADVALLSTQIAVHKLVLADFQLPPGEFHQIERFYDLGEREQAFVEKG